MMKGKSCNQYYDCVDERIKQSSNKCHNYYKEARIKHSIPMV